MDKTIISLFHGVGDSNTTKKISVIDLIWNICGGEWENIINEYRNEENKDKKAILKKNLPAVTFSGELNPSGGRLDDNFKEYSHLIVCDIDKISNQELNSYKIRLRNDASVVLFFESPSKGLKVVFKVSSGLRHHKSHAFRQVKKYMQDNYNITLDNSGSNPSRLCFISYDKDMYYNEDYLVLDIDDTFDYEALEKRNRMISVRNLKERMKVSYDSRHVFKTCCSWTRKSKVGTFHKGNRNNYIFYLSCLLNEAGMHKEIAIGMITDSYPSLGISEINTTVSSAYKKHSNKFGSKPIYEKKNNQSNLF